MLPRFLLILIVTPTVYPPLVLNHVYARKEVYFIDNVYSMHYPQHV